MARRIFVVVHDRPTRERLIAAGRENVRRFSWRESARRVLSVYEQVG
jgi:glycosyltransferase involved in cell wall biosynthesis